MMAVTSFPLFGLSQVAEHGRGEPGGGRGDRGRQAGARADVAGLDGVHDQPVGHAPEHLGQADRLTQAQSV